jgi:hypothetical protein
VLGQDYNGQEKKKDKILKFFKTLKKLKKTIKIFAVHTSQNTLQKNHVSIVSL